MTYRRRECLQTLIDAGADVNSYGFYTEKDTRAGLKCYSLDDDDEDDDDDGVVSDFPRLCLFTAFRHRHTTI